MHRNAKRRAPRLESLEERLCLAGSVGWGDPGQGSASLTYYIGNAPASLTQAAVDAAVEAALGVWAAVADISFTRTSQPNRAKSIDISFRTLDGPGGTLALAYSPDDVNPARIAGDIQFDAAEVWEVGNALGGVAMDLVLTAVHEIGHALGLDHSDVAGSLMAPTISPDRQFTGLARTDVASILALYAPARTTPTTTRTTPTMTPTTPTTTSTAPMAPTTTRTTPTTIPTAPTTVPMAPTTTSTAPTTTSTGETNSPTIPTNPDDDRANPTVQRFNSEPADDRGAARQRLRRQRHRGPAEGRH